MAVNIGTLRGYLELDTSKWVSRFQQSATALDDMASKAETLGRNMSVYLTAPLVGVGTVATKTFIDFETAMKGVQAALNLTGQQGAADLKRLEDAAIEWGAKTKFSATESAEALGELGKAGFDVNQSIEGLPSVLQLATVAGMGLADAATLTADTLTQFNLSVDQAGRVNDVLAAGAQASTIDVQQLGESLKYAGPVASAFGLSIEDTVGALSEFGNSGIKASMAGTALRSILTDIEVPTKGMKDTLEKLGIQTLKSADGTIKLAEVIDKLKASGATAGDVMTAFGDRAGPVMVSLVQKGSDGIRKLTDQMYKAEGAAQKVSDTMMSGLGGALEEMSGAVETAGMAMGRVLAPAVTMGAQAIGGLANILTTTVVPAFQSLPTALQVGIGGMLGLTAAAGPAIYAFAKLAEVTSYLAGTRVVGFLATAMSTLGNTIPVLTARVWLLDAAQKAAAISASAWAAASNTAIGSSLAAGATRVATFAGALASIPVALAAAGTGFIAWISSLNQTLNLVVSLQGPFGGLIAKMTEHRAVANTAASAQADLNDELQVYNTLAKNAPKLPMAAGFDMKAAIGEFRAQVDAALAPSRDFVAELENVRKQFAGLSPATRAQILAAKELGEETSSIATRYGVFNATIDRVVDSVKEATKHTKELSKATKEHEAFQKSMADSVWDTTQRLREIDKKRVDDALQGMQRSAAAIVRDLTTKTQAEQAAADTIRRLTMSTLEFQLDAIKRKGEAEKAALESAGKLAADTAEAIDQSTRVQTAVTIAMHDKVKASVIALINLIPGLRDAIERAFPGYLEQLEQANKKTDDAVTKTKTWRDRLGDLATSFTNLSQVSGGALSEVSRAIGNILNTMEAGAHAGETFMKGLKEAMGPGNKNWGSISANIATGLLGGFGAMAEATDPMKGTLERVIGGASTAAAIGGAAAMAASWATTVSATGQIYIVAAAAIVGAFVGYFRGQAARREMKIVGREWGQDISEGLAEEIRNAGAFGGDRVANAIFRMKDIIAEAGGVDDSNFARLIPRLRDVFVMVETGAFSVAEAQRVLNENFRDFAQASIDSGRLASRELQEIIRLNATMGVNASEVIAFVSEQSARAGAGLATIAAPITASIITWRDEVVATQAKLAELTEAGKVGSEEWLVAQEKLNKLSAEHGQLVAQNAGDLEALGIVALATFGAAVESGVGYVDAIRQVGPGIDAIIDAQKTLGITSDNLAVQDLANFRDRVRNNEKLVNAAEALDDTLLAVSHTTGLNADSLASMERLGLSTFQRLKDAGFSEVEALRMMGGFLENVTKAHMDMGIPIDDNIGALINLAAEHGVVNTKAKDFAEVFGQGVTNMVDAINALIKTLGGGPTKVSDLAGASQTTKDQVASDAGEMAKAQEGVGEAVAGVGNRLLDTRAWQVWRDAGVKAAEDVSYAVDAVSLGHSPGGIKEIPIKLRDAISAAQEFKRRSVADFEAVEHAVNSLSKEQVEAIRLLLEVGRPLDEIAYTLDISTSALDRFIDRERDVASAAEDAARAIESQRQEAERMTASIGDMNRRLMDEIGVSQAVGLDREILELNNRQRDEMAAAEAMRPTLGSAVDETIRLITQKFDILRNDAMREGAEERRRQQDAQRQSDAENLSRYSDLAQRLQDQSALIGKTGLERELLQLSFSRRDELADMERLRGQLSTSQIDQLIAAVIDKYRRLEAQARFDALPNNSFAEGTHGLRYFDPAGEEATLHGWEAVVPEDEYKAMLRGLRSPNMEAVSGRGGTTVVNKVTIDARGALLDDYESQQRLKRLFDDALMNDYEMRRQVGTAGVR